MNFDKKSKIMSENGNFVSKMLLTMEAAAHGNACVSHLPLSRRALATDKSFTMDNSANFDNF